MQNGAHRRIILSTLLLSALMGCGEGGKEPPPPSGGKKLTGSANALGPKDGSSTETASGTDTSTDAQLTGPDEPMVVGDVDISDLPDGPILDATYALKISADVFGGIDVCEGNFSLKINKDFTFSPPAASLSCMGGLCEVDMNAVLGAAGGGAGAAGIVKGLNADAKYVTVSQIGSAKFDPPRPLLLMSPFDFDPLSSAAKVREVYSGKVTDSKSGTSGSGQIELKVDSATDKQVKWHMSATGWEGVNKPNAFLVERIEMTWSVDPISLPHIGVVARIGDVLNAPGASQQSPEELAKLCSGTSGEVLSTLAGFVSPEPGESGGFMSTIVDFGKSLIEDVSVSISIDQQKFKILGQEQKK